MIRRIAILLAAWMLFCATMIAIFWITSAYPPSPLSILAVLHLLALGGVGCGVLYDIAMAR